MNRRSRRAMRAGPHRRSAVIPAGPTRGPSSGARELCTDFVYNAHGDAHLGEGDRLTLDGRAGLVYAGLVYAGTVQSIPERHDANLADLAACQDNSSRGESAPSVRHDADTVR